MANQDKSRTQPGIDSTDRQSGSRDQSSQKSNDRSSVKRDVPQSPRTKDKEFYDMNE
ncbi:MAG TPA: hypothetical protein PKC28_00645 [Bdellovibrionales bacterium]|nr:hypothetical protein [Bdellovibrionales bacterium]